MNQELERFLNLVNLPARATAEQAAGLLGFSPHEIPILTARGLLKPLGHPAPNAPKFFLTEAMKELRRDEKWMGKASDAISEYWRIKNTEKVKACRPTGANPKPVMLRDTRKAKRDAQ
jgi:hypothetical protein